jgi:hypothetical protein
MGCRVGGQLGAAARPRRDQRGCCERSSKQACANDARVCWSCVRAAPAGSGWAKRLAKHRAHRHTQPRPLGAPHRALCVKAVPVGVCIKSRRTYRLAQGKRTACSVGVGRAKRRAAPAVPLLHPHCWRKRITSACVGWGEHPKGCSGKPALARVGLGSGARGRAEAKPPAGGTRSHRGGKNTPPLGRGRTSMDRPRQAWPSGKRGGTKPAAWVGERAAPPRRARGKHVLHACPGAIRPPSKQQRGGGVMSAASRQKDAGAGGPPPVWRRD